MWGLLAVGTNASLGTHDERSGVEASKGLDAERARTRRGPRAATYFRCGRLARELYFKNIRHRFTKRDDGGETARAAKPVFVIMHAAAPPPPAPAPAAGLQVPARLCACVELNRRSGVLCTLLARGVSLHRGHL